MYGGNLVEIIYQKLLKNIDDLTRLFSRLRKDKRFKKEIITLKLTWVSYPFIKLDNLTDHLGGAQIYKSSL